MTVLSSASSSSGPCTHLVLLDFLGFRWEEELLSSAWIQCYKEVMGATHMWVEPAVLALPEDHEVTDNPVLVFHTGSCKDLIINKALSVS